MTIVSSRSLVDRSGNRISLGKKIGGGGEGNVFEVESKSNIVAKIYLKPLDEEKQEKLKLMVKGCNEELKTIAAWPIDLVFSAQGGEICGFTMQKISEFWPIHMLYGPAHRKQVFPESNWHFLVRNAKNCAAAFAIIHKNGFVIGDVNEGNILVNKQACVRLIDCDSFQVNASNNKKYLCEVGVGQFTPPELQNIKKFKIERNPNHDNFGLAVLIFLLLFMGRHPYSGVFHGRGDVSMEKSILEFRFAFSKRAKLKNISPPPNSVNLSIVPDTIGIAFEQAFTEEGIQNPFRPTAESWWNLLNDLEHKLKQCNSEQMHLYYSGLSACPWCLLEEKSGILLFLDRVTSIKFDLNVFWQKLTAIKPPGSLPNIDPQNYNLQPAPIPLQLQIAVRNKKIRKIIAILIIVIGIFFGVGFFILTILLGSILAFYPGQEQKEKNRREAAFEKCKKNWIIINDKWKSEGNDEAFKSQLQRLITLKIKYEFIEKEFKQELLSLQTTVKERQFKKYLDSFFIDSCSIPKIGPTRKAALRSFGIETAGDISYGRIRGIPGFGDVLTSDLVEWRHQIENNFKFDSSKGVDKTDIQSINQKFRPRLKPIERDLRTGFEKLKQIQNSIIKKREDLYPIVERNAKELAQAQANLIPLKLF
jgi:DNA-binding helix-hairpin-helix protein with protein kinase domain